MGEEYNLFGVENPIQGEQYNLFGAENLNFGEEHNIFLTKTPILGEEYRAFGTKSVIWAHKTGPKYIKNITNGVPVARHRPILRENEGTASGKLFKHLPGPPGPVFGPKTAKNNIVFFRKILSDPSLYMDRLPITPPKRLLLKSCTLQLHGSITHG